VRPEDLTRVVEGLKGPMAEFVSESRVRTAVLLSHSGQVLAQHGFSGRLDITNVAALAAAAHASAHALAEIIGAGRWVHLHHAGNEKQLFLAPFQGGGQDLVLVAIFNRDSTLGLVQLFFDRLVDAIREIPELGAEFPGSDVTRFELDLEAGIERVLADEEYR
jgi:predicted regulator of Ras-like GTPase activity (Roadblock/LC7/MglB family)